MSDANRSDGGAWIFVSHSHKDIKDVRRVRDALEAKGHNPLLFFLKALDDDSELDGLIRREIEARKFFLLCDSPNAQASRWVQSEVALITSLTANVYRSIDLAGPWRRQVKEIDDLARHATVFLSYVEDDRAIAMQYATRLRSSDYKVLDLPWMLSAPVDLWSKVQRLIDTALATGTVIILLSPDAVRSKWVAQEARYALKRSQPGADNVKFVIIRDREEVLAMLADRPEWALFGLMHFDDPISFS